MTQTSPVAGGQAMAYLAALPSWPPLRHPPLEARRRERKQRVLRDSGDPQPVASAEEVEAGEVPARLYQPSANGREVLVWFHGGGWVLHDVAAFDLLARALANAAGCAVLSVDYRLAPEHPFPAAVEDCWTATCWAGNRFERVAIGGDSADGNLATVTAMRARDAGLNLAAQLLAYPVVDYAIDTPAYAAYCERYELFAGRPGYGAAFVADLRWLWEQYLPDAAQRVSPQAAPIRAASLAGLPPAVVITAEHDFFRQEDEVYARRLASEGVPVELIDYPGQVHGFLEALAVMDDARDFIKRSAAAIRAAFSRVAHR